MHEGKLFECPECTYKGNRKDSLNEHIKRSLNALNVNMWQIMKAISNYTFNPFMKEKYFSVQNVTIKEVGKIP